MKIIPRLFDLCQILLLSNLHLSYEILNVSENIAFIILMSDEI